MDRPLFHERCSNFWLFRYQIHDCTWNRTNGPGVYSYSKEKLQAIFKEIISFPLIYHWYQWETNDFGKISLQYFFGVGIYPWAEQILQYFEDQKFANFFNLEQVNFCVTLVNDIALSCTSRVCEQPLKDVCLRHVGLYLACMNENLESFNWPKTAKVDLTFFWQLISNEMENISLLHSAGSQWNNELCSKKWKCNHRKAIEIIHI